MKAFTQSLVLGALALWFAVIPGRAGDNYSIIRSFGILAKATGFYPAGPLTQGPDGTLYGVTSRAEGNLGAAVFRVKPNGSGFQVLKFFTNNVEGSSPNGGLLLVGDMLYGTTSQGGTNTDGNIFGLTTNGSFFTNLYQFGPAASGGADPTGSLILSGGLLYGTTGAGGTGGQGTVYKISTNGTGISYIANFNSVNGAAPLGIVLSGSTIYGVTGQGGPNAYGTIFKVNTDTTGFTNLHAFSYYTDGGYPGCQLLLSGATLYGTTEGGGSNHSGVVFAINTNGSGYTNFFNFPPTAYNDHSYLTNVGGSSPEGGLVLIGPTLYGTTAASGTNGFGTIFEVNTNGSSFAVLKTIPVGSRIYSGMILSNSTLYGAEFNGGTNGYGGLFSLLTSGNSFSNFYNFSGSDGTAPDSLLLSNGTLYGITVTGGTSDNGTVYRISTNGSAYTNLYNFSPLLSAGPDPGLVLVGNSLYDTTSTIIGNARGSVFKLDLDGSGYTNLYDFTNGPPAAGLTFFNGTLFGPNAEANTIFALSTNGQSFTNLFTLINNDGSYPAVPLLISSNVIYGVAEYGGTNGRGVVFSLNTNGSNFKLIHTFSATSPFTSTNTDGDQPSAAVILSGNTLFGTAQFGGFYARGTVYRVDTSGSNFVNLHNFTGGGDGAGPLGSLLVSGHTLYGTTYSGASQRGTVFSVATNGANFTVLHTFLGPEGGYPLAGLIQSGNTLYGTATEGGTFNEGVLFSIVPELVLTVELSGAKVILSWADPTYHLQSAATITNIFSTINGATSPYTNPISGTQRYFRLSSN